MAKVSILKYAQDRFNKAEDFYYKIAQLVKKHDISIDSNGEVTNEKLKKLTQAFSANEQRFWCLLRMEYTLKSFIKHKDLNIGPLCAKIDNALQESKKSSNTLSNRTFDDLVNQYSKMVSKFLLLPKDENDKTLEELKENQESLKAELAIQTNEFDQACAENQRIMIIKGLICTALSVAAVALVIIQGSMCAMLSIPMALLGTSYVVLAHEITPADALSRATQWAKHFFDDKQWQGFVLLFSVGGNYFSNIKHNPILADLFKAAQDIIPGVPKPMLALVSAAAVPPAYFAYQYAKFRENTTLMKPLLDIKNGVEMAKNIQKNLKKELVQNETGNQKISNIKIGGTRSS